MTFILGQHDCYISCFWWMPQVMLVKNHVQASRIQIIYIYRDIIRLYCKALQPAKTDTFLLFNILKVPPLMQTYARPHDPHYLFTHCPYALFTDMTKYHLHIYFQDMTQTFHFLTNQRTNPSKTLNEAINWRRVVFGIMPRMSSSIDV